MKTKIALITGSGTRLGLIFARHLASRGYGLLLHYNNDHPELDGLIEEVEKDNFAKKVQGDFATSNGIEKLIRSCTEFLSAESVNLELIINSAAVMPSGHIGKVSGEVLERIFWINFFAPFLINQELIPLMPGGGSVINISDIASELVWANYPVYSMSKNALGQSTKYFAKHFAPGIRVNTLSFGLVMKAEDITNQNWDNLLNKIPLGRQAQISEILSAIDFLIDNQYITGQNIIIDGGRSVAG